MLWLTVAFVTDSVCNGVALFLFELVALDLFDETSMSTSDISVSSEQKSTLLDCLIIMQVSQIYRMNHL